MTPANILIVDDNAAVRALLRFILERAGYSGSEAASGDEALQLSRRPGNQFDLLITDVKMPGMGGRELVGRLAEAGRSTRVLYISGQSDPAQPSGQSFDAEFIAKPFTPADLLRAVEHALYGRTETRTDSVQIKFNAKSSG